MKIDTIVCKLAKWAIYVSILCIIYMMLSATVDVISTKFFNYSIPITKEIIEDLNIPLVFMGLAYVQLFHGNITGGVFDRRLSAQGKRAIELISNVIGFFIAGFISYTTFLLLKDFVIEGEVKGIAIAYQLWPFALALFLGFVLLTLAYIVSFIRSLMYLDTDSRDEMPQY